MEASRQAPNADRICIDFGTAFSKAGAFLHGDGPARELVRPLAIGAAAGAEHPLLTPSVMFVEDGRILLGPRAMQRASALLGTNRDPILSFKTILAAHDLESALSLKLRRSVDPTGALSHRDALVLYLAYLDQLIGAAIDNDASLPPALKNTPRRYTSPIWRVRSEADALMARLFNEAAAVSARLGAMLHSSEGASIAQVRDALERAARAPQANQLEAGVFEAHAAAAAYAAFTRSPKQFALVVDMGAGTTDLAAFERLNDDETPVLNEIIGARQCCGIAGDEIDEIIVNLLLAKLRDKKRETQVLAWRSLRLSARALKRDLFGPAGKSAFAFQGKKLTLRRDELLASAQFKEFCRALSDICAASLKALAERARSAEAPSIAILLAGGGANLPFMADVARAAGARSGAGCDIQIERFGADWYLPNGFDPNLREAYPQVAISLGGALAELDDAPAAAAPANV